MLQLYRSQLTEMLDSRTKSNPRERCMESAVRVFTYGSLCTDLGGSSLSGFLKLNLACVVPLVQLLEELDIDPDLVQIAMANHRAVPKSAIVRPGDWIALFPREYPIFADCVSPRMSGREHPADRNGE